MNEYVYARGTQEASTLIVYILMPNSSDPLPSALTVENTGTKAGCLLRTQPCAPTPSPRGGAGACLRGAWRLGVGAVVVGALQSPSECKLEPVGHRGGPCSAGVVVPAAWISEQPGPGRADLAGEVRPGAQPWNLRLRYYICAVC